MAQDGGKQQNTAYGVFVQVSANHTASMEN